MKNNTIKKCLDAGIISIDSSEGGVSRVELDSIVDEIIEDTSELISSVSGIVSDYE